MPRMASAPQQPLTDWDEEKAKQEEIAAEVEAAPGDGVVTKVDTTDPTPPVDPAPEPEAPVEQPTATLVPTGEATFPLRVSLVGLEDELVFESADDQKDVPLAVAEQVTYLPSVTVAE